MAKEGTLIRQKVLSSSPQIKLESPPQLNNQWLNAHYTHWPGGGSTGAWTELQNPLNSESESGTMEVTVEAEYSSWSLCEASPSFYPGQHGGDPQDRGRPLAVLPLSRFCERASALHLPTREAC